VAVSAADTNIVVRLLTRDDQEQFLKAQAFFSTNEVFLTDTVLLETKWVLCFAYSFSRQDTVGAFRLLIGLPNVLVADPERIQLALEWHEKGVDFGDALHLAACQDFGKMATFDKAFIRRAKGLGRCMVSEP